MSTDHSFLCRQSEIALDNLLSPLFAWGDRKKLTREPLRSLDRQHGLYDGRAPDGWLGQAQGVLACLAVMNLPVHRLAFIKAMAAQVPDREGQVLQLWKRHPWFMAAVRVKSRGEANRVTLELIGSPLATWPAQEPWGNLDVWSATLHRLVLRPEQVILVTLWRGLAAWHTYGPIVSLESLGTPDLEYLASCAGIPPQRKVPALAKGLPVFQGSLAQQMTTHPIPFLLLLLWSNVPEVRCPAGTVRHLLEVYRLPPGVTANQKSFWDPLLAPIDPAYDWTASGEVIALDVQDQSPWNNPSLVMNPREGLAFLEATTPQGLERGRQIMSRGGFQQLERTIDVHQSTMFIAQEIFAFPTLRDAWADMVRPTGGEAPEQSDEVQAMNKVMEALANAHNKGLPLDLQAIARQCQVPLAMVEQLYPQIRHLFPAPHMAANPNLPPPEAIHQLHDPTLPQAPGYLCCLPAGDLPAEVAATPVMALWKLLISQAALEGGLIPITPAGYLKPVVLQGIWQQLDQLVPPYRPEVPPKKQIDWPWLDVWVSMFKHHNLFRVDATGFRLSGQAKDLVSDDRAAWRCFLELSLYQRPPQTYAHGISLMPGAVNTINCMLYALRRQAMANAGQPVSFDFLGDIWLDLQPESIQAQLRLDPHSALLGHLQASLALGHYSLASLGLAHAIEGGLQVTPLFFQVFTS